MTSKGERMMSFSHFFPLSAHNQPHCVGLTATVKNPAQTGHARPQLKRCEHQLLATPPSGCSWRFRPASISRRRFLGGDG
jgi:hypothetical protein